MLVDQPVSVDQNARPVTPQLVDPFDAHDEIMTKLGQLERDRLAATLDHDAGRFFTADRRVKAGPIVALGQVKHQGTMDRLTGRFVDDLASISQIGDVFTSGRAQRGGDQMRGLLLDPSRLRFGVDEVEGMDEL